MIKKITIAIILLFSFSAFSQKLVYNKITSAGKFSEYQTKEGTILRIGDTIRIGYPLGNEFTFITQGDLTVNARLSNTKIIISKIKSIGNNNIGYKAYLFFKGYGFNVSIDYEAALETGEIKNSFTQ